MKIRVGFVSNSSSSSFIMLGCIYDIDNFVYTFEKFFDEECSEIEKFLGVTDWEEMDDSEKYDLISEAFEERYSLDCKLDEDNVYIGEHIGSVDSYEISSISIDKLGISDLKDQLEIIGFDEPVRLIFGMEQC